MNSKAEGTLGGTDSARPKRHLDALRKLKE